MACKFPRIPSLFPLTGAALVLCAVGAFITAFAHQTFAQSALLPAEIRDLEMGASQETVIAKIKSAGTYSVKPMEKENRTMLVWLRPNTPNYKNIDFQFTEKDRLYLIRFTLTDSGKADYHTMKRTIFKDYDFSWERPQKLRLPNRDMLLYGPETGMKLYFVEFTNRDTHEKCFELFDRSVSATDRPEPVAITKRNGNQKDSKTQQPSDQSMQPPADGEPKTDQPSMPQTETAKPQANDGTDSVQQSVPPSKAQEPSGGETVESRPPAQQPDAK